MKNSSQIIARTRPGRTLFRICRLSAENPASASGARTLKHMSKPPKALKALLAGSKRPTARTVKGPAVPPRVPTHLAPIGIRSVAVSSPPKAPRQSRDAFPPGQLNLHQLQFSASANAIRDKKTPVRAARGEVGRSLDHEALRPADRDSVWRLRPSFKRLGIEKFDADLGWLGPNDATETRPNAGLNKIEFFSDPIGDATTNLAPVSE